MQEVIIILGSISVALVGLVIWMTYKHDLERKTWLKTQGELLDRIQAKSLQDLQSHGISVDRSLLGDERAELEYLRKMKEAVEEGITIS